MAAVPATPFAISDKSQQGVVAFFQDCWNQQLRSWNIRSQLQRADQLYMRELDRTQEQQRAKQANKYGDSTRFQNITVPIVMPQVEAAVTHLASVFLTGSPIFGVTSPPNLADASLQMEAVIEENSVRKQWAAELAMFFRDGQKYNVSACEVAWCQEVSYAIETDLGFQNGKEGKPKEVIWSGNKIVRWDPYNMFWDTRVAPRDVCSDGEFAGNTKLMSRIALKKYLATLPDKIVQNVKTAFESGTGGYGTSNINSQYYVPPINPDALIAQLDPRASTNWLAWAGITGADQASNIQYNNMYEVSTIYARIMPSDFGIRVPSPNTPQVWKFIIVNGRVVIYAERQTNAHDLIPVFFHQPKEDGLDYQTKSLAFDVEPMQSVGSALINSAMSARRRAISDRALYDPSRVSERDINNPSSNAKIPVKPSAYGKDLREAVFPFPFRDDQSPLALQELAQIQKFADVISGQNQAQQGQFVKGNKTVHEWQDVMGNANGRNNLMALVYEMRFFSKVKEVIKLNILQYQQADQIYSPSREQTVTINPVELRKAAITFKISDGLLPSDKLVGQDVFQTFLQVVGSAPQIAAEYNIGPMVSYMMKMQNADLRPFEKSGAQVAYEKAQMQWSQTMQQAMEMAAKNPGMAMPQIPQPTPQQFGWNPDGGPQQGAKQSTSSIMDQYSQANQPPAAQQPNVPIVPQQAPAQ